MKNFEIKKAIFGGRAYMHVQTVRAANPRQAVVRFTQQTIKPRRGDYAVFLYGDFQMKFEVK